MKTLSTNYFYGNEVSNYGKEHGYLDYATLAKAFDAILNNDIMNKTCDIGYWAQESGFSPDNSDEIDELEEKISDLEYDLENGTNNCGFDLEEIPEIIDGLKNDIEDLQEEADYIPEIYQYFIVSNQGAEILEEAGEIVFYNDVLDMYVWGVNHWGTSWDYVLTNVKIVKNEVA